MRHLLSLLTLALAPYVWADREITVPKGRRLTNGEWRAELLGVPGEKSTKGWLGTGFLKAFDAELALFETTGHGVVGTLDFSYNFAPPLVDVSPGLSFGVQDAWNRTDAGRAIYVATTYRYGNDGLFNQDIPTEVTLGLWTRSTGLLFMAARMPFSEHLILIGEHNSERLAGGFELRPVRGVVFKTVFESGATSLGLSLTHRF